MLRRPWSQRPSGIASANAVSAGSAVSRPTSLADAPSRSRNTGRYVPDAVTMPTNTESTWTRVQLWARVEVLGWAGAMAATLPRSPPGGCPIPDDGARHARSNRPPDALHLRRLRRGVRARRDYGAARPAAAGPVRSFGDRPRRRGRRGRRGDRAPRTSPDARRDRCRPVGPGQPARAVPRRIRAPGGLVPLVAAALIGSVLGNALFVLGLAILVGGLRHGHLRFSE